MSIDDPFSHDRRKRDRRGIRLTINDHEAVERVRERYAQKHDQWLPGIGRIVYYKPAPTPRRAWGLVALLILGAVICAWAMFEMVVGGVGQ